MLRDRLSLVFLLVMPVFFTVFMGFAFRFQEADPGLPVAIVVDGVAVGSVGAPVGGAEVGGVPVSGSDPVAALLVALVEDSPALRVAHAGEAPAALEKAVGANEVAAAITVPEGYGAALLDGRGAPPLDVVLSADASMAGTVQAALAGVTGRLIAIVGAARLSTAERAARSPFADAAAEQAWQAEALAQAAAAWEDPPVVVLEAAAGAGAQRAVPSGFLQSSPGMMVQFAVFGLITTATVFHLERSSGTLRRMLTMPVARASIIGGHLLALCSVSFVQLVILAAFGQVALAVPYARAPAASLVMIVALALVTGCLGLVIGAFARSEDQVLTFSLVAMFVLASLGGAWFPLEGTGPAFARLAHLTPMAWAMDGLQNVILRGQGLRSVLLPAGVLVGWAAAFYALAVVRLRRG